MLCSAAVVLPGMLVQLKLAHIIVSVTADVAPWHVLPGVLRCCHSSMLPRCLALLSQGPDSAAAAEVVARRASMEAGATACIIMVQPAAGGGRAWLQVGARAAQRREPSLLPLLLAGTPCALCRGLILPVCCCSSAHLLQYWPACVPAARAESSWLGALLRLQCAAQVPPLPVACQAGCCWPACASSVLAQPGLKLLNLLL